MPTNGASRTSRKELLDLIGNNPGGHLDESSRFKFETKLQAYANTPNVDPSDVLFAIGSSVYGTNISFPVQEQTNGSKPSDEEEKETNIIIDFDYMKAFMKD
eukprot:14002276-Ditylum_brightwellii.AAC.1